MATGDETQAGPRPSLPPHRPGGLGNQGPSDRGGFVPEEPLERFGADYPTTNFNSADTGVSDFPSQQSSAPKPQILAHQANEWDENQQEIEVVKSRRTGLILLFLLAMLLVALIALGLAAFSVFSSGDPIDTSAQSAAGTDDSATDDAELTETTIPVTTTIDPNLLDVVITEQPFVCDGAKRVFAQLSGAAPNEEVAFSSPQTANLASGAADANGALPINWSCTPDQAGTTWELTASGVTSGKIVTFIFSGALAADAAPADPGATPAAPTALAIELVEEPFACNGEGRIFGGLSGADPGEEVAFTSPQASAIKNGTADANGDLAVRWSCTPDQAGTVWELTATGVTSGKSVVFSLTGA